MIRILIDPTYPAFASLAPEVLKQVSVSIGPTGMNTAYFNYQAYPLNSNTIGDSGVNQASPMVSMRRPLLFSRESFGIFGNVTVTDYSSGRLAALLANYVDRGVLIVEDAGAPMTSADILTFVP